MADKYQNLKDIENCLARVYSEHHQNLVNMMLSSKAFYKLPCYMDVKSNLLTAMSAQEIRVVANKLGVRSV